MGNEGSKRVIEEVLSNDKILTCSKCQQTFDLSHKMPIMICLNQHNVCSTCINHLTQNRCTICKENVLLKKKKNTLLCYILLKLQTQNIDSSSSQKINNNTNSHHSKKNTFSPTKNIAEQIDAELLTNSNQNQQFSERKINRSKTFKKHSASHLTENYITFQQQRQFKKKYSVAAIFNSKEFKDNKSVIIEDDSHKILKEQAQHYEVNVFKKLLQENTALNKILHLDLPLLKINFILKSFNLFENLQHLSLNKNAITKIQNLSKLSHLKYLSLSENKIELIENLQNLRDLQKLFLNKNNIAVIQNLNTLQKLQYLSISDNQIARLQNLSQLLELRWLNLQHNRIKKMEGLESLMKLQTLALGSNQISIFEGIALLPSLKQLHFENNQIEDVSQILSIKHLTKLKLEGNPGLNSKTEKIYFNVLEIMAQSNTQKIELGNANAAKEQCQIY